MRVITEFMNISPAIINLTDNLPDSTEEDFLSKCQCGDIIVSYTRRDIHPNILTYFGSRTLGLFQGGLFTSIKMVSTDNKIIGYGVQFGNSAIREKPIKDWIKLQGGVILLRIPGLTEKQKRGMVDFLRDREGLDYNFGQLVSSAFKRLKDQVLNHAAVEKSIIDGKKVEVTDSKSLTQYVKEVKTYLHDYTEPLICSTVIYLALKSVGSKLLLAYDTFEVWPRDFLLSDKTNKICKFIRSEDNTNER